MDIYERNRHSNGLITFKTHHSRVEWDKMGCGALYIRKRKHAHQRHDCDHKRTDTKQLCGVYTGQDAINRQELTSVDLIHCDLVCCKAEYVWFNTNKKAGKKG